MMFKNHPATLSFYNANVFLCRKFFQSLGHFFLHKTIYQGVPRPHPDGIGRPLGVDNVEVGAEELVPGDVLDHGRCGKSDLEKMAKASTPMNWA